MSHKIFLSHNHGDKPVVEAVALKLAGIFGQDQVFYDSWSIKPGDGIIDQMNKGLEAPEFVFFFVSAVSLASGMVKLEWQNALHAASKGRTRIIPVRVDGSAMPAVLQQTLYIDMHTVGMDAAIAQIVSVTQGSASFTPQHQGFSNLSYSRSEAADGSVDILIKASHLMEPNVRFAILVGNTEQQIGWTVPGVAMMEAGFNPGAGQVVGVGTANVIAVRPVGKALTPSHPVLVRLTKTGDEPLKVYDVFHEQAQDQWAPVPKAA